MPTTGQSPISSASHSHRPLVQNAQSIKRISNILIIQVKKLRPREGVRKTFSRSHSETVTEWDEVSSGPTGSKPHSWAGDEVDTLFKLLFFTREVHRGSREGKEGQPYWCTPHLASGCPGEEGSRPYQAGRRVVSSPVRPGEVQHLAVEQDPRGGDEAAAKGPVQGAGSRGWGQVSPEPVLTPT